MSEGEEVEIHAVLLAAGLSSRMGDANKLLAEIRGEAMVRHVAAELAASRPAGVVVVTGHERKSIEQVLHGLEIEVCHNPDFATGQASSLKRGVGALPAGSGGAMIVLADMPRLTASDFRRLMDAFRTAGGDRIVRATDQGRPGNPVILPRRLFAELEAISGDRGARDLVERDRLPVIEVEIGPAALHDVDEPADLEGWAGKTNRSS